MEKQLLGSEAPLVKSFPLNMDQESKGALPLNDTQEASNAPNQRRPSENYTHPSSHRTNFEAAMNDKQESSMAPLSHTPYKGWESIKTPMSKRSEEQSR